MSADAVQPSTSRRVLRLLAIIGVFVLIGPPVGALVFILLTGLIGVGWRADAGALFVIAALSTIYVVPLSYLFGIAPAVMAGGLIGLRLAFFGPVGWFLALAIGAPIGLLLHILTGQSFQSQLREGGFAPPVFVFVSGAATIVCWAIVRRWHLPSMLGKVES